MRHSILLVKSTFLSTTILLLLHGSKYRILPKQITYPLPIVVSLLKPLSFPNLTTWLYYPSPRNVKAKHISEIKTLAEHHEVADKLSDLIQKDGAGSWPPNANHNHVTWPSALQPYKEIYLELASLLPQANRSLDDDENLARITNFRERFRKSLQERVKLDEVMEVSSSVYSVW